MCNASNLIETIHLNFITLAIALFSISPITCFRWLLPTRKKPTRAHKTHFFSLMHFTLNPKSDRRSVTGCRISNVNENEATTIKANHTTTAVPENQLACYLKINKRAGPVCAKLENDASEIIPIWCCNQCVGVCVWEAAVGDCFSFWYVSGYAIDWLALRFSEIVFKSSEPKWPGRRCLHCGAHTKIKHTQAHTIHRVAFCAASFGAPQSRTEYGPHAKKRHI